MVPPAVPPAFPAAGAVPVPLPPALWVSWCPQVSFEGEPGADEGGLGRELFSVAARTLCQPDTGPFHHLPSGLLWFPSQVRGPRGPGRRGACAREKAVTACSPCVCC